MLSLASITEQDKPRTGLLGRPANDQSSDSLKHLQQSISSSSNNTTILQQLQQALESTAFDSSSGSAGFANTIVGAATTMTALFDTLSRSKSNGDQAVSQEINSRSMAESLREELSVVTRMLGTMTDTPQNKNEATATSSIKTDDKNKKIGRDKDDDRDTGINSLMSLLVNALKKAVDPDVLRDAISQSNQQPAPTDPADPTVAPEATSPNPLNSLKTALANQVEKATRNGNLEVQLKEQENFLEQTLANQRMIAELNAKATELSLNINRAADAEHDAKNVKKESDAQEAFAQNGLNQVIEGLTGEGPVITPKPPSLLALQYSMNAAHSTQQEAA